MKIFFAVFVCLLFAGNVHAQKAYVEQPDTAQALNYLWNGIIEKQDLLADSGMVKWYEQSRGYYKPDTALVGAFKRADTNKITFLVFGGTWCEDTHFVLPKLYKLQELAGLPASAISLVGTDRNKKTIGGLAGVMDVHSVPTIIVLKNGIEAGRVIEYGKTGKWDREVAALIP